MEEQLSLRALAGADQLWTRERAKPVREAIFARLSQLPEGGTLILDLKGIEVFDFSYANELFGKIALTAPMEYPGRFVVLEGLKPYTKENLQQALESLRVAMIERKGKIPKLIGKYHPTDQETFTAIWKAKGPVIATEIADKLNVKLNAMNERLTKLTEMGLLRRQKIASSAGREQFQYQVLA